MNFLSDKTKEEVGKVAMSCREKRKDAFSKKRMDLGEYKDGVAEIRQKVFNNFEDNLKIAKKRLKENGFIVREAKDALEARQIIARSLEGHSSVVKTKTNTSGEIRLDKVFEDNGDKNISETDLGDFIVNLFGESDMHYVLPALHITSMMISDKIKEKWGDFVEADAEKLTHYLCGKIRENIIKADLGITGVNFFTKEGQIVLLENEGNISLVSRIPSKHIMICGIDKLVENEKDALDLCRASALFGTGQEITQYVSIISGPSKTADIQNEMVEGAQGAKEVEIILLDNGRREALESEFKDLLKCVNCGSCINFCPAYRNLGVAYGGRYIGPKGIVMEMFNNSKKDNKNLKAAKEAGSFKCILCGACKENCPMKIDLPSMLRKIRHIHKDNDLQTRENIKMIKKIKKYNNPFGDVDEEKVPDKLYCC